MSTRKDETAKKTETETGEEIPVTFHDTPAAAAAKAASNAGANAADIDAEAAAGEKGTTAPDAAADHELNKEGGGTDDQAAAHSAAQSADAEDPLTAAKNEAADYYDRLLRLSAEFENYKKRSSRELADFRKFANEMIIKDLLGVIDNLERALASAADQEGNANSIAEGVELTLKEIFKILEKNGVTAISADGEAFDPTYHQAVMQQETTDHPPNTVVQELQKGYLLHNRLLRPSMVVVSKDVGA
ncbi:MAG: nucleotide exchange factor GrpE [Desulfosarcinaceae bacterium]|jgi:molecular chaperone GrpE